LYTETDFGFSWPLPKVVPRLFTQILYVDRSLASRIMRKTIVRPEPQSSSLEGAFRQHNVEENPILCSARPTKPDIQELSEDGPIPQSLHDSVVVSLVRCGSFGTSKGHVGRFGILGPVISKIPDRQPFGLRLFIPLTLSCSVLGRLLSVLTHDDSPNDPTASKPFRL
jgi:hypothetical protein